MELLQAIIEACEEEKAPVMLQISKGARDYAHPVYLKKLIEAAVSLSNIPIAIHLDHGDSFELCKQCIDEGFTSVMIDASHDPFEKNVEICRKVVDYAHKHNCVVEGELGMLVGAQHDDGEEGGHYSKGGCYTHPEEAVDFVKKSGVDSLAVAIGNKGLGFMNRIGAKVVSQAVNMGDTPHLEQLIGPVKIMLDSYDDEQLDAVRAAVTIPIVCGSTPGIQRADLAARGVRFHLQGHAVLAACAKAMFDTYAHLAAGNGPDGLQPILATPETMARVLRLADHEHWEKAYLN